MKKYKICPRCGHIYSDYPAISRKDNKTEICAKCGTLEALEEFSKITYAGRKYWKNKKGD